MKCLFSYLPPQVCPPTQKIEQPLISFRLTLSGPSFKLKQMTKEQTLKSKYFQISFVILLVFWVTGPGLALPPTPCNCAKPDAPSGENPHRQEVDCCGQPVKPTSADCPCGDNCHHSFQSSSLDFLISFTSVSLDSSSSSRPFLSVETESARPDPPGPAIGFSTHSPLPGPLFLQIHSLRC